MVKLRKREISGKKYFYLEHSLRDGKKVEKREKYIGSVRPKNIDKLKKEFLHEIHKEEWFKKFDSIKKNFSKEQNKTPPSAKAKKIKLFAIKFTYNTNKIEGSTLTFKDTARLIEDGIAPKKSIYDIKETESHEKVFYEILKCKKDLSLNLILNWHKQLFKETKQDIAGKIREHGVEIAGSKFVPPTPAELNVELKEFFKWYNKNKDKIHPVKLAASTHLKFVTIHLFSDGNGRISRLMMNHILNRNKYPMTIIPYENRNSYYNALEKSQTNNDSTPFLNWFFKWYLKEHKKYLK